MAPATLSLASAASSWPWTRERNRRAIQYSAESPSTAPKAPATITRPRSRYPCAASVDAVFSVVSPGSTAIDRIAEDEREHRDVRPGPVRALGVGLPVERRERDDHGQQGDQQREGDPRPQPGPPAPTLSHGRQARAAPTPEDSDDQRAEHGEERPDPAQVGPVGDPGDGQSAHHDRRRRDEQVHQAGGALVRRHDQVGLHADERRQRGHDRHRHGRQPGRRRDQERQRQEEQEDHDREPGSAHALDRLLGPVQDGVGDPPVVHDHGDAAGDPDDQGHPEQVACTVDEGVGQLVPRSSWRRHRSGPRTR